MEIFITYTSEDIKPAYATKGSSGADLKADIQGTVVIQPGQRKKIPTGIKIELPNGFEAQIRPRSGLADKHGVTLLNSPGTIDSDYRGEIQVILINVGENPFIVKRGDRIAQMVISQMFKADFLFSAELASSARGEGGFGSTGQ
jgi:dUTP pyrophosphatase